MRKRLALLFAVAALVFAGLFVMHAIGCASGRSADGKTVVGFPLGATTPDDANDAVTTAGGVFGGIIGGPGGALLGSSIASAVAAVLFGRKSAAAERQAAAANAAGWDDRAKHQAEIDAAYVEGQHAATLAAADRANSTAPPNPG